MSLEKQINDDFIKAMKEKDDFGKQVLSFLRSEIKNAMIEMKKRDEGLTDAEVTTVLKKHKKKLTDTADQMAQAGRADLAEEAKKEIAVVDRYLPASMTPEALAAIVKEAIAQSGAVNAKDMGKVIKLVVEKTAGAADGKSISEAVKAQLA